jgi:hypothetical protein
VRSCALSPDRGCVEIGPADDWFPAVWFITVIRTSVPVTPALVAPPLSPENACAHDAAYTDST